MIDRRRLLEIIPLFSYRLLLVVALVFSLSLTLPVTARENDRGEGWLVAWLQSLK